MHACVYVYPCARVCVCADVCIRVCVQVGSAPRVGLEPLPVDQESGVHSLSQPAALPPHAHGNGDLITRRSTTAGLAAMSISDPSGDGDLPRGQTSRFPL